MSAVPSIFHPGRLWNNRVVRNGIYGAGAFTAGLAALAFFTPLLLRTLGTEAFALWMLSMSILSLVTFLESGIATTVVRFVAVGAANKDIDSLSSTATISFLIAALVGVLITGVLFAAAPSLTPLVGRTSLPAGTVTIVLRLTALGLLPVVLRGASLGVPMAFQRFELPAMVTVAQTLASWGAAAALSPWHPRVEDAVLASVLSTYAISCTALAVALWTLRRAGARPSLSATSIRPLISFAILATLTGVGTQLFSSLDRISVGVSVGIVAVAYYSVAVAVAAKINQLSSVLWQGLVPVAAVLQASADRHALRAYVLRATLAAAAINIAIAGVLLAISGPLLSIWLGSGFAGSVLVAFRILIVVYAIFSINAPAYHVANGIGAAWFCAVSTIIGGSVTIGLILLLGRLYGLNGAAVANAGFLETLGIVAYVFWRTRVRRPATDQLSRISA